VEIKEGSSIGFLVNRED